MLRVLITIAAALFAACAPLPADHSDARAPREAAIVPLRSERPLVALALGSGGARAFAHVGVIKVLEANGIVPDIVTGSSSGAVVAALYAGGHSAQALEKIALGIEKEDVVDFVLFGRGWVRGEALQEFVNRMVGERPIERLPRALAIVATHAESGRGTVFNRGDTGIAVRASASVPNLFLPPRINGAEYVDGGLASPVPARLARAMGADVVIAVDVSWFAQGQNAQGPEMARYGRSGRYALLTEELDAADIVVTPRTVRTRMLDFDQKEGNIAAGEEAAREMLPEIRKLIAAVAARKRQRWMGNDDR